MTVYLVDCLENRDSTLTDLEPVIFHTQLSIMIWIMETAPWKFNTATEASKWQDGVNPEPPSIFHLLEGEASFVSASCQAPWYWRRSSLSKTRWLPEKTLGINRVTNNESLLMVQTALHIIWSLVECAAFHSLAWMSLIKNGTQETIHLA